MSITFLISGRADPVFFASHCGKKTISDGSVAAGGVEDEYDRRLASLGVAVEFARTNNLLGVFVDAELLVNAMILIDISPF